MLKKIVLKIINAISILAIAASVIVLLMVVLTRSGEAPSIMGYSVFRVTVIVKIVVSKSWFFGYMFHLGWQMLP